MAVHTQIDRERSKRFMMRMFELLNSSAVTQMISLGNRTGVFDAMSDRAPSTSSDIARAAGLQDRYVRELLNGLVTGGVVDYESTDGTYVLPAEHAAFLTTAAGPRNLSAMAKMLFASSIVEPSVAECFRSGGGVPYEEYTEFHEIQRDVSGAVHDATLVDAVIPMIDGMPERMAAGIDVADVGCGAGHAVNLMAAEDGGHGDADDAERQDEQPHDRLDATTCRPPPRRHRGRPNSAGAGEAASSPSAPCILATDRRDALGRNHLLR